MTCVPSTVVLRHHDADAVLIRIRMPVVVAMVTMTRSRSPVVESTIQGYLYANLASLGCIVHLVSLKFIRLICFRTF